jgi:hypothetical protein
MIAIAFTLTAVVALGSTAVALVAKLIAGVGL